MTTENMMFPLFPGEKTGMFAAMSCIPLPGALTANGQASVFQQLLETMAAPLQEALPDQEHAQSDMDGAVAEDPSASGAWAVMQFLAGPAPVPTESAPALSAMPPGISVEPCAADATSSEPTSAKSMARLPDQIMPDQVTAGQIMPDQVNPFREEPANIGLRELQGDDLFEPKKAVAPEKAEMMEPDSRKGNEEGQDTAIHRSVPKSLETAKGMPAQNGPQPQQEPAPINPGRTGASSVSMEPDTKHQLTRTPAPSDKSISAEPSEELGKEQSAEWTGEVSPAQDLPSNRQSDPVEKPDPCTQIKREVLDKLEQKGPTEFKMRLEPEDLGEIDIKLKLSSGKLIIQIASADPKTQSLLTGQVDKLIQSMGLPNAQVEITAGTFSGQDGQSAQNQSHPGQSGMDLSQRQQRDSLQRQWHSSSGGTYGAGRRREESGSAGGLKDYQMIRTQRMDYII